MGISDHAQEICCHQETEFSALHSSSQVYLKVLWGSFEKAKQLQGKWDEFSTTEAQQFFYNRCLKYASD